MRFDVVVVPTMDDIAEFLKVYPLSDEQDSFSNLNIKTEPCPRGTTPDFLTFNYQQQVHSIPQPRGFSQPYQTFPLQYGSSESLLRIPDLKALIPEDQAFISQGDLNSISLSQMAPHTGTRGATRAQVAAQNLKKPTAFIPAQTAEKKKEVSAARNRPVDITPQMPVLTNDDAEFSDHGDDSSGLRGGKVQTGRQRSTGPLSAHAIYARMNRERKKKYIADLEEYRKVMLKKRVDQRKELDSMHRETEVLTQEIAALRNELVGNDILMNLLSAGIRH